MEQDSLSREKERGRWWVTDGCICRNIQIHTQAHTHTYVLIEYMDLFFVPFSLLSYICILDMMTCPFYTFYFVFIIYAWLCIGCPRECINSEASDVESTGTGVTDGFELPAVYARNCTIILCQSSMCSYLLSHLFKLWKLTWKYDFFFLAWW